MNLKLFTIAALLSATMSVLAVFVYHKNYSRKVVYIDIKRVFNEFAMKKELEEKYKQTEKQRNKILDSLSFDLKVLSKHLVEQREENKKIENEEAYQFEYAKEKFLKFKRQFEEDNAALSSKYDAQILAQLTQYVSDYGKRMKYDIILGADGNGNLMYSNEAHNISEDVIIYINNKYKGVE